jgi:hypothetical protein
MSTRTSSVRDDDVRDAVAPRSTRRVSTETKAAFSLAESGSREPYDGER